MILDKIENHKLYINLSQRLAQAFAYINETDFSEMESGKYTVDNDNIYAILQNYQTKEKIDCKLEGHNKYIDIQYIINGVELIGVTTFTDQIPIYINKEKDYSLYESTTSMIRVEKGMFAIFFPDDLHMPGVKSNKNSDIKKVVVKVKI
ncbi:YhcH/YjgK/YiaL family protein [Maribacter sp. Asnod2-G09]|uniref:YhcH/YjgK/YiaL family protein n=1 Tax=Maribacter sp. Asnod2-G09 TaxID=3160577 RepID=UPI00386F969F